MLSELNIIQGLVGDLNVTKTAPNYLYSENSQEPGQSEASN
jgi:hypothetical protein